MTTYEDMIAPLYAGDFIVLLPTVDEHGPALMRARTSYPPPACLSPRALHRTLAAVAGAVAAREHASPPLPLASTLDAARGRFTDSP